jgi:glutathione synthase/RimK-type ligase-like ATP-grasp enzyme
VEPAVWDDPDVTWSRFDAVVVRSCWDYHLRSDAFDAWIGRLVQEGVPLWNPPEVLRWNARKTYLRELEAVGVPTVPTRFIEANDSPLEAILDQAGWDEVVIKPVVSASAHETWRASRATIAGDHPKYARLLATGPLMVQPFLSGIMTEGEWSLCFFEGRYSHAVLKRPRPGDFRVQADHGGKYFAVEAPLRIIEQADAALRASGFRTLYARVDGCLVEGGFRLMELELLEPGLFLATNAEAPIRLADAVMRVVRQE